MIISASRRTDIPAFYSKWFMNRIREGFLLTKNPFNSKQISTIDLRPKSLEAVVFWTRNPSPLIPYLDELDKLGYNYYFQFTITGYPKILEKNTPQLNESLETFKKLSSKIGSEKVIWRYDPIIFSNITDLEFHYTNIEKIAKELSCYSNRMIISFVDLYKKTEKNLRKLEIDGLIELQEINQTNENFKNICTHISKVAHKYNFEIFSCAESFDLSKFGIKHGKCIDEKLLNELFNLKLNFKKDRNQREECGCMVSKDIGIYNTCIHGCEYCYANVNKSLTQKNFKLHDCNSPLISGEIQKGTNINKNKNFRLDDFT